MNAARFLVTVLSGVFVAAQVPPAVQWNDRRPIGSMFIAATPAGDTLNPRGYFNDRNLDIATSDGLRQFQSRLLKYADESIRVLKSMNAQGMVQWDLEGAQSPQPITYVCDPRQLPLVAPEMDSVADIYFRRFTDAGLKVGVCVRPQNLILDATGRPIAQSDAVGSDQIIALLIDKIGYAKRRWGATIFYVDSNVAADSRDLPPSIFQAVQRAFPDILLIAEHHNDPVYWTAAAAYSDLRLAAGSSASTFHFVRTPDSVKALWPSAFSVINATTANLVPIMDELVRGVRAGDILLFHGWFDDQPTNGQVQYIYRLAAQPPAPLQ